MIKMFSKKTKNQKGFTLVELIVVIAIIGILGAIAVPKFGGFRETATVSADKATSDVIRNAVTIALANGDIVGNGSFNIEGSNITSTTNTLKQKSGANATNPTIKVIMDRLLDDVKAQETSKTGFTVTIGTDGNVTVVPK